MCTCLSSSAEKRWWIYSFTFRWRKYDQGRKGPLVNKDSFFTTDQSTTLTNYIWYVYRHMCVLVHIHMYNTCMKVEQFSAFINPGVGETSKRCRCSYVHVYRHGITVSWICRSYVRLCILHTPPLLIQSETWPSQSKTKPFLSLPLPVHVSRSLSQSLTFSNQVPYSLFIPDLNASDGRPLLFDSALIWLTRHPSWRTVTFKKNRQEQHRQGGKSLIVIGNLRVALFRVLHILVLNARQGNVFKRIYMYLYISRAPMWSGPISPPLPPPIPPAGILRLPKLT